MRIVSTHNVQLSKKATLNYIFRDVVTSNL